MYNFITTYDVTCLYVYTFMHYVLGREQGQTITIGWRNDWEKEEKKKKRTKIEARPAPSRGQFLSIRVYIVFSVKRKKVRWKKENPPQDLTRLCRGAKGHLMNNGWWRNGNQFLSKPLRLLPLLLWGPGHVSSSNHMCCFLPVYISFEHMLPWQCLHSYAHGHHLTSFNRSLLALELFLHVLFLLIFIHMTVMSESSGKERVIVNVKGCWWDDQLEKMAYTNHPVCNAFCLQN